MRGRDVAGQGKKNVDDALVLALAAGASAATAAQHAGVCERTARRRLEDAAFRARVDEARGELVRQTVGRLAAIGTLAGSTLHGLLAAEVPAGVRLGASRAVLEFMFRGHEVDTLARQVEELKRQVEELTGGSGSQGGAGPAEEAGGVEDGGEPDAGPEPAPR